MESTMHTEKYDALFREYKDRIYRLALRIVRDSMIAEDVVQEVHVKCWQNRDTLEEISNPGAWIMRVAKNLSIDKLRASKPTADLEAVTYSIKTRDPIPDRVAETGNLIQIMQKILEILPAKQKMVFHLREVEGLQYKEIGEVLEITVEEVKINLFRARQKIKDKLIKIQSYGLSRIHTGTS